MHARCTSAEEEKKKIINCFSQKTHSRGKDEKCGVGKLVSQTGHSGNSALHFSSAFQLCISDFQRLETASL